MNTLRLVPRPDAIAPPAADAVAAPAPTTRLRFAVELDYLVPAPGSDFIFNVHAAHTPRQRVVEERLALQPAVEASLHTQVPTHNRYLRLSAPPGPFRLQYQAVVELAHHVSDPAALRELPVSRLPPETWVYLAPSRYCPSDLLHTRALREFGQLAPGWSRVEAVCAWVREHVRFTPSSTNSSTSAMDTLVHGVGVCRDFAHLMIALCRALNIPARFATGIDYGADPRLGPNDFHAYVEVYLEGGWYVFDPSGTAIPMGLLRVGTGRDAADVAFATFFGAVGSSAPRLSIEAVPLADGRLVVPFHRREALSTDVAPRAQDAPAGG